jgi:hypothetical protein
LLGSLSRALLGLRLLWVDWELLSAGGVLPSVSRTSKPGGFVSHRGACL